MQSDEKSIILSYLWARVATILLLGAGVALSLWVLISHLTGGIELNDAASPILGALTMALGKALIDAVQNFGDITTYFERRKSIRSGDRDGDGVPDDQE